MHLSVSVPAKKSFCQKSWFWTDLGLLNASVGMGVILGKKIRRFSSKTEACTSSYGRFHFWMGVDGVKMNKFISTYGVVTVGRWGQKE